MGIGFSPGAEHGAVSDVNDVRVPATSLTASTIDPFPTLESTSGAVLLGKQKRPERALDGPSDSYQCMYILLI